MTWIACPKIDKFWYFYHPSLFEWHYFCLHYLTAHIKLKLWNRLHWKIFWKKHRDVSRTIVTVKMELFVALVSSFQPLTNFTKNPNISAMEVLNAPLNTNVFWNLRITVACNFSKDNLFQRLMNYLYLNSSSNCICISYPS